jgi:hypothetical protein
MSLGVFHKHEIRSTDPKPDDAKLTAVIKSEKYNFLH